MNREEAAKILEYPVLKWCLDWDEREDGLAYCDAIQMAIDALRAQQVPNPPLTLEELREMDGEPVWCVLNIEAAVDGKAMQLVHKEEWGIVASAEWEDGFIIGTAFMYYMDSYGKSWLAYRRKPEEETR